MTIWYNTNSHSSKKKSPYKLNYKNGVNIMKDLLFCFSVHGTKKLLRDTS